MERIDKVLNQAKLLAKASLEKEETNEESRVLEEAMQEVLGEFQEEETSFDNEKEWDKIDYVEEETFIEVDFLSLQTPEEKKEEAKKKASSK